MNLIKKIKVQSQTDKNKSYLVQIFDDGGAVCECPYWKFKSHDNLFFQCKHIKRAFKYLEEKNATK